MHTAGKVFFVGLLRNAGAEGCHKCKEKEEQRGGAKRAALKRPRPAAARGRGSREAAAQLQGSREGAPSGR